MTNHQEFQTALTQAKHIIVLAGAGLSAASGIPTFRGAGGLWRKYDAMVLASQEAFQESPGVVWQFYHYRREVAFAAQPNPAHRAIALLCSSSESLRLIAPSASSFHLVTQNVDNLSSRALPPSAPTSARPIEMHGNICRVRCTGCDFVEDNFDSPICAALAGTEKVFEKDALEPVVKDEDLPRCPKCAGLLRPGVVWFGESVERLEEIAEMLDKRCDLLLVVGTSSAVSPANVFADVVRDHGGKVAVFNIEHTPGDKKADFVFLGPCEQTLVQALRLEGKINSS